MRRLLALPAHVDVPMRDREDERLLFLMNHNDEEVAVDLPPLPPCRERLAGKDPGRTLVLPGGEVAILHWRERTAPGGK
jgi:hypothetical protein